jgi:hypothetical protein
MPDAEASNKDGFVWKNTCVSSTQVNRPNLEQTEPISTLKTVICRKYSFQKFTQFLLGNNVLDPNASNTDDFLWRDTCVSSSQLNRPT